MPSYPICDDFNPDDVAIALSTTNCTDLVTTIRAIAEQGEAAAAENGYLNNIVAMLDDQAQHPDVKCAVCYAVQRAGAVGLPHQQSVARLLSDDNEKVRYQACVTLGSMGPAASGWSRAVSNLLQDERAMVRTGACSALAGLGGRSEAKSLVKMLADRVPEVQGAACLALGRLEQASTDHADEVARKLDVPRSRPQAAEALGMMGEAAKEHVASLCECLTDEDDRTRVIVASAIGRLAAEVKDSPAAFRKITELLEHSDGRFRAIACVALGNMGGRGSDAEAAVKQLLTDDFEEPSFTALVAGGGAPRLIATARIVKCGAAFALGAFKYNSYAGDVTKLLMSEDYEVRACACDSLAAYGTEASDDSIKSNLSQRLTDDMYMVRGKAVRALAAIGDNSYSGQIVDLLEDPSPSVRVACIDALVVFGDAHIGKVFECLSDESAVVRAAAASALGRMGPKAQAYAAAVAQKLVAPEAVSVKVAALEALGRMGKRGAAYAEEVSQSVQDPVPQVRAMAVWSLGQMGRDGQQYIKDA